MRCAATLNCCNQQQLRLKMKHIESKNSFTLTRLGSWVDTRLLNSSVFSVGALSAEAEWNWVTSVLMAFSRSEYWEEEKEGMNERRKTIEHSHAKI